MQINAIKKLLDQADADLISTDCEPQLISFKDHPIANCDKCVEIPGFTCPGVERPFYERCPDGYKYRRDPPDGGYYG